MLRGITIRWVLFTFLTAGLLSASAWAQEGRIAGVVSRLDGNPLPGVTVLAQGTGSSDITGADGSFVIRGLPAGAYTLEFVLGENFAQQTGIEVQGGGTTHVGQEVDWEVGLVFNTTVRSASRQKEKIVEAPAAITSVTQSEISRNALSGQLPKLLEFTPGVELTQGGLYDFNLNTRGFNSSLNRRVAVLVDGRDVSAPFLGAQEWAAAFFSLDELASAELVRGPSAALYGKNAASGVLNLTSRSPRYSQGGQVRFTGGQLDTTNLDFRWAGELGKGWYVRTSGGARRSTDFSVSRNQTVEYSNLCPPGVRSDCLTREVVPLAEDTNEIYFGSIRLDKFFSGGTEMTIEGGISELSGPVVQTSAGRLQLLEVRRPYARFSLAADHWNFQTSYSGRKAPRQLFLSAGTNTSLDTYTLNFEGQTHWNFAEDRVRWVAGASYSYSSIDSENPQTGRQTLLFQPVDSKQGAVFSQIDFQLGEHLKLVFAGRVDESTLHDVQFSPKASAVITPVQGHSFRISYNEAFQVPNYSEFFLQADVAAPINLSAIERNLCTPFGVDCGFGRPTRVLGLGNESLELEKVQTLEFGYSGILGSRGLISIDYYRSQNENFISDLIPQLDAFGNRTNPNFGPYQPPSSHPNSQLLVGVLQQSLPPFLYAILTNNLDGTPIFGAVSYTNFGEVDTQGIELGGSFFLPHNLVLSANYTWFDFELADPLSPLASQLEPNSPEHQASAGLAYLGARWDAGFSYRWVDSFRWAAGAFQGNVDEYTTADLTGNLHLNQSWSIGWSISNLFDDRHWESFGGDLLRRRALASLMFKW